MKAFCQEEREKEPHYNYLTLSTSVYTNATGTASQKLFMSAELGRTFGIFDIGLSAGRLSLAKADSNWFIEVLTTINVFSKGRFSEALTLGAGRIIKRTENFLTEITNSINFAPNNRMIITVYQGNYFFDGKLSTSRAQFMGLSVTFNFIKKGTQTDVKRRKSLLN
jgi:hypothetical protein